MRHLYIRLIGGIVWLGAYLITAFALKPKLLMLDEPVNGMDFQSTEYLYRQIGGYSAMQAATTFIPSRSYFITQTAQMRLPVQYFFLYLPKWNKVSCPHYTGNHTFRMPLSACPV